MRRTALGIITILFSLALCRCVTAQERVTAAEAGRYLGKAATVCGKVASSNYAARSRGHPTFLNLDRSYPNQIFTALIWGDDRSKFATPPDKAYEGKKICVTGTISNYRGQAQIIVKDPVQIAVGN